MNDLSRAVAPSSEGPEATESNIESRLNAVFAQQSGDTPESDSDEPVVDASASPVDASDGTEQQQPSVDDTDDNLAEVELEGQLLKVPPLVKDAVMRHVDYTRKTMVLADERKVFEQERRIVELQKGFDAEIADENKEVQKLNGQLEQFRELKWHEMDTDQMTRAKHAQDMLRDRLAEVNQAVNAKKDEFLQRFERSRQELQQQGAKYLTTAVPGWNANSSKDAAQGALNVGFTRDEIVNFLDPRAVQLAFKAYQWDKLQASKPAVMNKGKDAPPVTRPGSKATTESTASTQYRQMRANLKKSGDMKDAAKLFLLKG